MKKYAIVIGEEHYNTLGIIRSLGQCNFYIYYLETGEKGLYVRKSKYVNKYKYCLKPEVAIQEALNFISGEKVICAIYPTNDTVALALDENYKVFEKKSATPGARGNLRKLLDKHNMSELARIAGLNTPKETIINFEECDLNTIIETIEYPCIIKPLLSLEGFKSDITICDNVLDLNKAIQFFKDKGYKQVLMQKFLMGEKKYTVEIMGECVDGKIMHQTSPIKKIREYPTKNGSTSYAVFMPELMNKYEDCIDRMIDLTGFSGLYDIEFIVIDDVPYFIEMNFRNGAPSFSCTHAGVNLPYFWYEDMLQKNKVVHLPVYDRCFGKLMAEHLDFRHVKNNEVNVLSWFKEYHKCEHKTFIDGKDIRPLLGYILLKIRGRLTNTHFRR